MIRGCNKSSKVNQAPLLQIKQLELSCADANNSVPIVRNLSLELYPGEIVALVGPSGCGKSMTAQAIVGLLDSAVKVTSGSIFYKDVDVCMYTNKQMQVLRRDEIAFFIQQSLNGLNPIRTVRKQMTETLLNQKKWNKKEMELYHTHHKMIGTASLISCYQANWHTND